MYCLIWSLHNFWSHSDFLRASQGTVRHTLLWNQGTNSIRIVCHPAFKTMAVCETIRLSVCHCFGCHRCSAVNRFRQAKIYTAKISSSQLFDAASEHWLYVRHLSINPITSETIIFMKCKQMYVIKRFFLNICTLINLLYPTPKTGWVTGTVNGFPVICFHM